MTLTRRTPLKRKPRKRRAPGVGCQNAKLSGKRCGRNAYTTVGSPVNLNLCALHAADKLTGDYVKAREPMCRNCGSMQELQWAHVFSRRYKAVRWDTKANTMTLCRSCHMYFTDRPAEWEQWCRDRGIDWDMLRWMALHEPAEQPEDVIALLTKRLAVRTEGTE